MVVGVIPEFLKDWAIESFLAMTVDRPVRFAILSADWDPVGSGAPEPLKVCWRELQGKE